MENEHSWEENSNTHTLVVGGSVPAWGTVLFVLSDSATHFCLPVHELNHFKALKGDYPGVRWRARYLFGWLYQCLYAEVAAGPLCPGVGRSNLAIYRFIFEPPQRQKGYI